MLILRFLGTLFRHHLWQLISFKPVQRPLVTMAGDSLNYLANKECLLELPNDAFV